MVGDYYISCLTLPAEEEQPINVYGQRYLRYLKEYHRLTYTHLLTCGRLNEYLVEIDKQAQERFERLIEGTKQAQGITEQPNEMVGARRETIVHLENGRYNPSLKLAMDIAKTFNVTVEELFEFIDNEK